MCTREACSQDRIDLMEAVAYIKQLDAELKAKRREDSEFGRAGDGHSDELVHDLQTDLAAAREANNRLMDDLERSKEHETTSKEQVSSLQRELRQAQAARADAEDSVQRMQGQIVSYERELSRYVC